MDKTLSNDFAVDTKAPRRKRRGLGIVELGLYLIIVSLLVAAVIVAFYQLQTNSKQSQVTNLVNEVYSAVNDLHRSATSYGTNGTDLIPVMEAAEMLPPIGRRIISGNPALYTPFGEPVTVAASGGGTTFTVTLQNYTAANCIDFMSNYVDRTLEQSGIVSATSNGTALAIPATVASISTGCAAGDLAIEFR